MTVPFVNSLPIDPLEIPEAQIITSDVPFDDSLGQYTEFSDPQEIFVDYTIHSRFEKCSNRYMLSVSSPNGFLSKSVATVQLSNPTLLWICDWTGARTKTPPEIPDPTSQNSDWVLLYDYWEPGNVGVAVDGVTPIYRISGTYVYGKLSPASQTVNDIFFPRVPWIRDGFPRFVSTNLLRTGLSEPEGGGGLRQGGL